jgi:hypothetical protein
MRITGTNSATPTNTVSGDAILLRQVRAQLRAFGGSAGGQLSVVRDPETQRFVIQVLDPETKAVLNQFPAESILRQLPKDQ